MLMMRADDDTADDYGMDFMSGNMRLINRFVVDGDEYAQVGNMAAGSMATAQVATTRGSMAIMSLRS